ncbi:MAG: PsbP-related protein [Candidatus Omnitrophota bacterium]
MTEKRTLACLFMVLLMMLLVINHAVAKEEKKNPNSFSLYQSEYYSLKYPRAWEVRKGIAHTEFNLSDGKSGLIVFAFKVSLTTQDYTEALVNKFGRQALISSEISVLDHYPAPQLTYLRADEKETYKLLRIYTVEEGILYDLVFTFKEYEFRQYRGIINKIINSFRIKTVS